MWPLHRPTHVLPVISFMAEAMKQQPEVAGMACTSIVETAADKFVGLTRRAGAELAGLSKPDPTLVRHLHDLRALRPHYDPVDVVALAREIMPGDAEAYGNKFPAYRTDPILETRRAIDLLETNASYLRRYEEFLRLMVFGDPATYEACFATLRELACHL